MLECTARRLAAFFDVKPMLTPTEADQRRQITINQAEANYFVEAEEFIASETNRQRLRQLKKPFGFNNERWQQLKGLLQEGDELWEFCSSQQKWNALEVVHRLELVRKNQVIAEMVLKVS